MSDELLPQSQIVLYQTEDGRTRIQCRFQDETVWLTQKLMAASAGGNYSTLSNSSKRRQPGNCPRS